MSVSLFQRLIQDKQDGKQFSLEDLTEDILRTLYMEEEVPGKAIAELFDTTKKRVDYKRLKYGISFIERIKNSALKDEKFLSHIHEVAKVSKKELNSPICALSFSVSSSREDIPPVYLEDCDSDEWANDLDVEEKYFSNIHIDIYGYLNEDLTEDEKVKVGVLWGTNIEPEITMEDYGFPEVCDIYSQELCDMATAVSEDGSIIEKICDFDKELFFLDRIFIEPQYRGFGIGTFVIKMIPQVLKYSLNIFLGSIVIFPKAQERNMEGKIGQLEDKNLDKQKTAQLIKYYKRLGFKLTKNRKYMYRKLE